MKMLIALLQYHRQCLSIMHDQHQISVRRIILNFIQSQRQDTERNYLFSEVLSEKNKVDKMVHSTEVTPKMITFRCLCAVFSQRFRVRFSRAKVWGWRTCSTKCVTSKKTKGLIKVGGRNKWVGGYFHPLLMQNLVFMAQAAYIFIWRVCCILPRVMRSFKHTSCKAMAVLNRDFSIRSSTMRHY